MEFYARIQRGGGAGGSGPDQKATKPAFNVGPIVGDVGQPSAASDTPSKWRFAGGPMMARFLGGI